MQTSGEFHRLRELERELRTTFASVPADQIHTLVEQTWLDFLHAPVRDCVLVLIRRQTIDDLRPVAGGVAP
jgi:hypothetical protein